METFTMSRKEVPRAGLLKALLAGKATNAQGAAALRLSVRQVQRLKVRFQTAGAVGVGHRSRGRPATPRLASGIETPVIEHQTQHEMAVNQSPASRKNTEEEGHAQNQKPAHQ